MRALDLVAGWPVERAAAGALRRRRDGPHHDDQPYQADGPHRAERAASPNAGSPSAQVEVLGTAGDGAQRFAWASVTKLCTALAVLVAVEEGTLALSEAAGPPGATVEHLLAHASGLAADTRRAVASPGTRRIYSNAGYELLGELLEARAEMAFSDYLAEAVFAPVRMTGARLERGASPASGASGTLGDLLRLAAELLAPTIVSAETFGRATSPAFAGVAGVLPGFGFQDPCDWGLGFEIRNGKEPHWTGTRCSPETFGHFGRSGAFVWVDPRRGVACAALADREFGPWAAHAWPALSDALLDTRSVVAVGGDPRRA